MPLQQRVIAHGYRRSSSIPSEPAATSSSQKQRRRRSLSSRRSGRDRPRRRALHRDARSLHSPARRSRSRASSSRSGPAGSRSLFRPKTSAALTKAAHAVNVPWRPASGLRAPRVPRDHRTQAADVLQPDLSHFGGILEARKIASWADSYYILVAPHNVGGPVVHSRCTPSRGSDTELQDSGALQRLRRPVRQEAAPGLPEVVGGVFALPAGPGLGVTLNEDAVREHPPQHDGFNLFAEGWERRGIPLPEQP